MAYTTITDLQERQLSQIVGSEFLLLSDPSNSYKVTLNTINERLIELSAGTYQELTNKVIDDVSNYVHANAIHFAAKAVGDIDKGTPVVLVSDIDEDFVYVAPCASDDNAVGICEDGLLDGELGEIMVSGILSGYDTSAWLEGDLLYSSNGVLTNTQPSTGKIQFIGYVLNSATNGKILVSGSDPYPDARQILFDNTDTDLTSTNVQDAITEVDSRMTNMEEIVFQQAVAPTIAEGASDGDIWMDTTSNTLNVYREYPTGTGVYRWEPLLYKWDDVVDGGGW